MVEFPLLSLELKPVKFMWSDLLSTPPPSFTMSFTVSTVKSSQTKLRPQGLYFCELHDIENLFFQIFVISFITMVIGLCLALLVVSLRSFVEVNQASISLVVKNYFETFAFFSPLKIYIE